MNEEVQVLDLIEGAQYTYKDQKAPVTIIALFDPEIYPKIRIQLADGTTQAVTGSKFIEQI